MIIITVNDITSKLNKKYLYHFLKFIVSTAFNIEYIENFKLIMMIRSTEIGTKQVSSHLLSKHSCYI